MEFLTDFFISLKSKRAPRGALDDGGLDRCSHDGGHDIVGS